MCSNQSNVSLCETSVEDNLGFALECRSGAGGEITKCSFVKNKRGIILKELGCVFACSGNTASVVKLPEKSIPGFKINVL